MKAINRVILFMCITVSTIPGFCGVTATSGVQGAIKTSVSGEDTAKINMLIREGFRYIKESSKGTIVSDKAETNIDSASFLCEKNKIDYPPLLHLLKAEFYFARSDFNTSEQEARKCIEKAGNSRDYLSQAKGLIFLGKLLSPYWFIFAKR